MKELTQILCRIEQGDGAASEQLLPLVYGELCKLASNKLQNELPGQTLQATALVHEAYLRLVDKDQPQHWNGHGHFFGAAAESMRRILVEQARRKKSMKFGGQRERVSIETNEPAIEDGSVDILVLDEILNLLEMDDSQAAQVVKLRYFAGLTIEEAASSIGISIRTANRDWAYAKAWLLKQLSDPQKSQGISGTDTV